MLKRYVKLTYICWTTNQIYIVIIFSQFSIRKDTSVGSTLASWTRGPRFESRAQHLTEFFFLLVYYYILLACDFYISSHSLSFFSNWGKLDVPSIFHVSFSSFLIFHELESTDISIPQQLPARGRHVYSFLSSAATRVARLW